MGQKVNPHGLRVGVISGWDAQWYASKKDFGKYLLEYYDNFQKIIDTFYFLDLNDETLKPHYFYYSRINNIYFLKILLNYFFFFV